MLVAIHHGALGLLSLVALAGIAQAVEIGRPRDRPKTAQACNNQNQVLLCKGSKWTFDQQCSGDEVCTGTIYQIDHFETLKTEAGKPAPATEEERAFCTKRNPGPPPSLPCDPNTIKSHCSDDWNSSWGCYKVPGGGVKWLWDHDCEVFPGREHRCEDRPMQWVNTGPTLNLGGCNAVVE